MSEPNPASELPELQVPIYIIAFDRPDYLRRLCASLKAQQNLRIREDLVNLMQDGSVSPRSGLVYGDPEKISASIAAFREFFPNGHVHASPDNLGIAMNIRRAEQMAFVRDKAPVAYFFEDDLELGPVYMQVMEMLRVRLAKHKNVGYFAAYGRHNQASDPHAPRLVPMGHLWGFGLTRHCWAAMQPLLKPFFDIYARTDYTSKPHLAIYDLYKDRPVSTGVTSQDGARTAACAELGFARVVTDVCYARYIGELGVNFRPGRFIELGFDRATSVDHLPAQPPETTPEIIAEIAAHLREHGEAHRRTEYETKLAELQRVHFNPDTPVTREELLWLWRLTRDRVPPEDYMERVVGKQTLRKVRRDMLRSNEAKAKCFHMT